jgi:hypothetical protein
MLTYVVKQEQGPRLEATLTCVGNLLLTVMSTNKDPASSLLFLPCRTDFMAASWALHTTINANTHTVIAGFCKGLKDISLFGDCRCGKELAEVLTARWTKLALLTRIKSSCQEISYLNIWCLGIRLACGQISGLCTGSMISRSSGSQQHTSSSQELPQPRVGLCLDSAVVAYRGPIVARKCFCACPSAASVACLGGTTTASAKSKVSREKPC